MQPQKGSATIVVFIVLLLTLGGTVWYFKSVSLTKTTREQAQHIKLQKPADTPPPQTEQFADQLKEYSTRYFSVWYPSEFTLIQDGFSNYGDGNGILCHKNSNWEDVMEDESGDISLEGCLMMTTARIAESKKVNSIDAYSETFFTNDMDMMPGVLKLKSKEKIIFNGEPFIKATYTDSQNKEYHRYIAMNKANEIMEFSFIGTDATIIPLVEKILSSVHLK